MCTVLCKYVSVWEHLSVSVTTGTETEKESERRKWDRQQRCELFTSSLFSPFCHRGEAKEVTHTYKHSINLPATLFVLDTVPALSVCLPATLPSCCHLSAAGARLQRHEHRGAAPPDAHFSARAVPRFSSRQLCFMSVYCAKRGLDRDRDKTCPG